MTNKKKSPDLRNLSDLRSIGPAALKDFKVLGIKSVDDLKNKKAMVLYEKLCEKTNARHDPCVIDVFRCAIEQANNPNLEPKKKNWWYWTKFRKSEK